MFRRIEKITFNYSLIVDEYKFPESRKLQIQIFSEFYRIRNPAESTHITGRGSQFDTRHILWCVITPDNCCSKCHKIQLNCVSHLKPFNNSLRVTKSIDRKHVQENRGVRRNFARGALKVRTEPLVFSQRNMNNFLDIQ